MTGPTDFARLVPGFDFLQGLMKNAGQALPDMGQWIAPTLDPEELGKRIEQLRTVQFWLEQNARMLATTIQALEVQRMTLSTLKTMNMPMDRMREAFTLPDPPAPAPAATREPEPEPTAAPEPAPRASRAARAGSAAPRSKAGTSSPAAAGVVDPMQWWGALTQQFTELAASALKDTGSNVEAVRQMSGLAGQAGPAAKSAAARPAKSAATRKRSR
jgi:hypothetical protein